MEIKHLIHLKIFQSLHSVSSQTTLSDGQKGALLFFSKALRCAYLLRHSCLHQQCRSVTSTAMRMQLMTQNTSTVAKVFWLWLEATTANRSACSQRTPTKPWWHTHAGVSSRMRKRHVPWKQKWRWESGQSSKWERTAAATNFLIGDMLTVLDAMVVAWFSGLPVDEPFVEKYGKAVELLSKEVLAPLRVELFCPDPNVKREPLINNKVSQRIFAIIIIIIVRFALKQRIFTQAPQPCLWEPHLVISGTGRDTGADHQWESSSDPKPTRPPPQHRARVYT